MTSAEETNINHLYVAYFTTPPTAVDMVKCYDISLYSTHVTSTITSTFDQAHKKLLQALEVRAEIRRLEKKKSQMANIMKSQEARKVATKAFLQRHQKR